MKKIDTYQKDGILVSVCCICYNQSSYIEKAIKSFLMQKTNFSYEIIINDDCSTDGTIDIIKKYAQLYPSIIRPIFHNQNQYSRGIDIFYNNCILNAKGLYIAICEGDDYWIDPFKLQKQVDIFKKYPTLSYCFTNRVIYYEASQSTRLVINRNKKYNLFDFISGFNPGMQSVMFSISNYKNNYNNEIAKCINGDRSIPFFCLQNGGIAMNLDSFSAVYRVSCHGVSTSRFMEYSSKDWFVYSTNDFHKYHETIGFPSLLAYQKGMGKYLYNYFKESKKFSISTIWRQVTRNYHTNKAVAFALTIMFAISNIILALYNKIQVLKYKICHKVPEL